MSNPVNAELTRIFESVGVELNREECPLLDDTLGEFLTSIICDRFLARMRKEHEHEKLFDAEGRQLAYISSAEVFKTASAEADFIEAEFQKFVLAVWPEGGEGQ